MLLFMHARAPGTSVVAYRTRRSIGMKKFLKLFDLLRKKGMSASQQPMDVDAHHQFRSCDVLYDPACQFGDQIGIPRFDHPGSPDSESDTRLSQAMIQKFKMFILLADTSSDAYFLKDLSFKYVYVNSAMERLLNLPRAQIIGLADEDLYLKDEAEKIRAACSEVLEGWTVRVKNERHIQGEKRTFLDTLVPWRDEAGEVTAIYGTFVDITDRTEEFNYWQLEDTEYPSSAMRSTLSQALLVSRTGSTVLLTGESGSGKDFLAQYIHDHSERSQGPHKSINCAAIPSGLVESELFGHEKGAFNEAHQMKQGLIELAQNGTLLLNEIGELPLGLQAKLLTFLDTRSFTRLGGVKEIKVDARIIAATNRNLEAEIKQGTFRGDLFYRLNVFSIRVPPLRDRTEDIPILIKNLGPVLAKTVGMKSLPRIRSSALEKLMRHKWPGNVRELRNVLEKALIESQGAPIEAQTINLPRKDSSVNPGQEAGNSPSEPDHDQQKRRRVQRRDPSELHQLYHEYIVEKDWTRADLAKYLDLDSSTLKKWFKEAGLPAGRAGRPMKLQE
jgi:PAS domain S-box-containing protein